MRIRRLEVQAFNRFRAPWALPLERQGLVLVEGENRDLADTGSSNGAGKSLAVVETVLYCGWGRMARYGAKLVAGEAAHPINGAHVTLWVDGWRVTRSRTPQGDPHFEVVDETTGQPVALSRDPHRRTEEATDLFGLDYVAARAALVLSGERGGSLAESPFAAQMGVLESLLRFGDLSAAEDRARDHQRAAAGGLARAETEQRVLAQALRDAQEVEARTQAELATEPDRDTMAVAVKGAQRATKALPAAEQRVQTAQGAVREAELQWRTAETVEATAEQARTAAAQGVRQAVCPTCGRPFEGKGDLDHLRAEEVRLKSVLTQARAKAESARAEWTRLDRARTEAEAQTTALRLEAHRLEDLRARQAEAARARQAAQRRLEEAVRAREQAEARLAEATARADAARAQQERAGFWVRGFGRDGLQAELFAAALPVLNHAAQRYSQLLANNTLTVEFAPQRAKRTEDLIRLGGTSAPTYAGCSSGEKQRVDLIVALSLRALARWRLPEPIELAIFDEVFDHLDEDGLRTVARLLQDEVAQHGTVLVVTHNLAFKALFPGAKLVRVIRERGEAVVHYTA